MRSKLEKPFKSTTKIHDIFKTKEQLAKFLNVKQAVKHTKPLGKKTLPISLKRTLANLNEHILLLALSAPLPLC